MTKQKPFLIVFALLVVLLILCLSPVGGFLTTLLAFVIPAFQTFKALESENKDDDKRLLTFWVTFGFLYFFDQLLSWFLSFIPLYYLFRTALIFYLYHPKTNGSEKLYKHLIEPFFQKYSGKIDNILNPLEEKSKAFTKSMKEKLQ